MLRRRVVETFFGLLCVTWLCATANATISNVSWRPGQADPNSIFTIDPAHPTTNDIIDFFDPRDHVTYGNLCKVETSLGVPHILVDPAPQRVNVTFTPQIGNCTEVFDPVSGVQGFFGELSAGDWVFNSQPGVDHHFTVTAVPEPGMLSVLGIGMSLAVRRRPKGDPSA